jgi:hypothetical protein
MPRFQIAGTDATLVVSFTHSDDICASVETRSDGGDLVIIDVDLFKNDALALAQVLLCAAGLKEEE